MNTSTKKPVGIAVAVILVILVVFLLANSFVVVEAGTTGVVMTLGRVGDTVLTEGFHPKIPFAQKVVKIDNRVTKLEVITEAFSKDLQTVTTTLAINYRVDATKSQSLYKNVGRTYESILVNPAVNEVLKAITAQYTAEESVTNRAIISDGLISGLNAKLNADGLYVTDVNILNFDFSEAFINAIEEKQVAQQQLLKAETEKQTAITTAEAEAETIRIKAQAEADANTTVSQSLTEMIIENKKIEKWDGKLPQVQGDADPLVTIN